MKQAFRIDGDRLYLRSLNVGDAGEHYLRWLNDPEVNRFLESRRASHTVESVADFVRSKVEDPHVLFVGVFLNEGDRHIGNIKLEPIDSFNQRAEIGILLGEKDLWGKGYATEALELTVRIGFDHLGLHKLTAGCYAGNLGSMKAFRKAGFFVEGTRRSHFITEDGWVDLTLLGILNERSAGP